MDIVLINRNAAGVARYPSLIGDIEHLVGDRALVIATGTRGEVGSELEKYAAQGRIRRIYLVGGDGTFNCVLQWAAGRPEESRPTLICVGGGQFCYMRVVMGMPSRHPLVNLTRIFEDDQVVCPQPWRPVALRVQGTDKTWYAALIGNGLVSRYIAWYNERGKGDALRALLAIGIGVFHALFGAGREHPLLRYTAGTVKFDDDLVVNGLYAGLAVSTVNTFSLGFAPFQGVCDGTDIHALAFSGSVMRLAAALPWVYFGAVPWFAASKTRSRLIKSAVVVTGDGAFVLDGELEYPAGNGPNFRTGEAVRYDLSAGPVVPIGYFIR